MKATIKKYWLGKATVQRVKLKEYGMVDQFKFYLFGRRGLCIWTENHKVQTAEDIEQTALCQIYAERQVSYSEMTANLPELSNKEFDQFQNEIYPTRF